MRGLITDRTQQNVARRAFLSQKGWANMTVAERNEWAGNPLETDGANILPNGPYYSSVVDVKTTFGDITATSTAEGTYLYSVVVIGDAARFENKTLTLSIESVETESAGVPQIALYWHSDNGQEYAGASLFEAGSVTVDTAMWPNTGNRASLALYVYVTTTISVQAREQVRFKGVMVEMGSVRHPYAPYTEIAPTAATKGAYNYSDLNRVERAVAEISELANLGLATKTDWSMWDIPTSSDMERYLDNVETIKNHFGIGIELPESMNHLTVESANNIEKVLVAGYERIGVT